MGAIHFQGTALAEALTEMIGYKCGVTVTIPELNCLLQKLGWDKYTSPDDNFHVRIHSSEFQDLFADLMYTFGRIENNFSPFPTIELRHKFKHDQRA